MELALRAVPIDELTLWSDTGGQPFGAAELEWHPEYPTSNTVDALRMLILGSAGGAPPWGLWQMIVDEIVIGDIGFHGPPDAAGMVEIGYQVVPAWRRQGVASAAVGLIIVHAAGHGAVTVRAEVVGDNPGSSRSLQHNGFRVIEQHGETIVWSRAAVGDL